VSETERDDGKGEAATPAAEADETLAEATRNEAPEAPAPDEPAAAEETAAEIPEELKPTESLDDMAAEARTEIADEDAEPAPEALSEVSAKPHEDETATEAAPESDAQAGEGPDGEAEPQDGEADAAAPAPAKGWPGRIFGFVGRSRLVSAPLLVVIALVFFLPGFFSIPPVDRDEARFAQASRQMVETRDFIDIRFQAEARHKKPIGIYWLQSAAAIASGEGAEAPIWVYRLPSLAGAVLAVLLTWWAALPIAGRSGAFFAGLMMAAAILPGVEARLAKTDAVLLACLIAAQGGLLRAFLVAEGYRLRRLTTTLFWTGIGLGILVKGPIVPMVTGLTTLTLMLFSRSVGWFARLRPLTGLLWVLVIVLPWLVAIGIVTKGAFFTEALGKDLLAKVGTGQESHGAPPGTYLAAFWGTFWPIAPFFALAVPFVWRHRRERGVLFTLAWIVPSWLVFEAVATKLPHYVLPLYPAFAILTAAALFRDELQVDAIWKKLVGLLVPLVPVVLAVGVPVGLFWLDGTLTPAATALTLVAAVLSVFAWRYLARNDAASALVTTFAAAAILYAGVYQFAIPEARSIWLSPRLADVVLRSAPCRDPQLATAGYREPSLVFLTRTDLAMVKDDEAASFLAEDGCRVAFVEGRGEEAFRARATELGFNPHLLGRVAGRNLNGGKELDIGVFMREGAVR